MKLDGLCLEMQSERVKSEDEDGNATWPVPAPRARLPEETSS
jgi:hypothetical protein